MSELGIASRRHRNYVLSCEVTFGIALISSEYDTGDTFVLHSEDTLGPDGGSFSLESFPLKLDVTGLNVLKLAEGTSLTSQSLTGHLNTPANPISAIVLPDF